MKLLCIKEDYVRFGRTVVSLNRIYDGDVYSDDFKNYWEVRPENDSGIAWIFSKDILMPLTEYRNNQIESIINGEEN